MERRKIAKACFIGGFICCATMMAIAPRLWLFGLFAGIAAGFLSGYLAYEFKKVLQAIPAAWRQARRGTSATWQTIWKWLKLPHPFFFTSMATSLPFCIMTGIWDMEPSVPLEVKICRGLIVLMFALFFGLVFWGLALLGSREKENCYWMPYYFTPREERIFQRDQEYLGRQKTLLNYRNFFRWLIKGTWLTLYLFFWEMWVLAIPFYGRFLWRFFKIIHSKKRVLCGIDGTLGGSLTYFWLSPAASSFMGQLVVTLCGGIIGAAIGVLNYEIISVRLLHLEIAKAQNPV